MGDTVVSLRVHGGLGVAEIDALVDTGATFTKIPGSLAATLGLQRERQVSVELGDGRVVGRALAFAEVELEGERGRVPVTIGGAEERPLVGYTTLEILGFKVNPVTKKLEKTTAIEYRFAVSRRYPAGARFSAARTASLRHPADRRKP